ncbi:hypothetical protein HYV70_02170 [Candidatus Uhrbacteria bacterium]|nr:hypothetical protein [Candidatus Uhrbacteria bacterium]
MSERENRFNPGPSYRDRSRRDRSKPSVVERSQPKLRETPRSETPEIVSSPIEAPVSAEHPPVSTELPEAKPVSVIDADRAPDGEPIPVVEITESPSENFFLRGGKASGMALAFLGYQTGRAATFLGWRMVIPGVDWAARKMDSLGDKLLSKHFPFAKKIGGLLDKTSKWIGLDKTLFDIIKEDEKKRRELAEKALGDFYKAQTDAEKKADAAIKRKKRGDKIQKAFGSDAAKLLLDEMEEIEEKAVKE